MLFTLALTWAGVVPPDLTVVLALDSVGPASLVWLCWRTWPLPWKAVGLTATVAKWALSSNSRRGQEGRGKRVALVASPPKGRGTGDRKTHPGEIATAISQAKKENPGFPGSETCQAACQSSWPRKNRGGKGKDGKGEPLPGAGLCRWGCYPGRCSGNRSCQPTPRVWGQEEENHKVFWLGDLRDPAVWAEFLANKGRRVVSGDSQENKKPPPEEGSEHHPGRKNEEKEARTDPPREEGDGDKGGGGDGGQDKARNETSDPPLCYGPVCCSCTKQGVDKLRHTGL